MPSANPVNSRSYSDSNPAALFPAAVIEHAETAHDPSNAGDKGVHDFETEPVPDKRSNDGLVGA